MTNIRSVTAKEFEEFFGIPLDKASAPDNFNIVCGPNLDGHYDFGIEVKEVVPGENSKVVHVIRFKK